MKRLPNIARERLRVQGAHPDDGGASAAASAQHLDANLIAAFLERSALPAERTRILEHLSGCDRCRAEVRLVMGAAAAEPHVARTAPAAVFIEQPWWKWTFRWEAATAGAAAALVLVAFWVSIRAPRPAANAPALVARNSGPSLTPSVTAQNEPAGLQNSSTAEALRLRLQTEAMAKRGDAKKATGTQSLREAESKMLARMAGSEVATPLDQRPTEGAPAPPFPATVSAGALPAPEPAEALVVAKPSAPSDEPREIMIPSGAAPTSANSSPSAKALPVQRLISVRPTAVRALEPGVRWATSDAAIAGTLEESVDSGRTWRSVVVAQGVRLRAVCALDREVWAGGAGGSLFHSRDEGRRWTVVAVSSASATLASEIVAIQFGDPAHGSVTAANGQRWTTSDGGAHWQVQ